MSTILEIAQRYLMRCKNQGSGHVQALCPVHDDHDPSFSMNTENGLWLCFSCGATGNLRQFLELMGVGAGEQEARYRTALEQARKARRPTRNPLSPRVVTTEPLPEEVLGLFRATRPLELINAGFKPETLDHFEVGFDSKHYRTTYPLRDLRGNLMGISGRAISDDPDVPRYKVYTDEYEDWGMPVREEVKKGTVLWHAHTLYGYVHFHQTPEFVVVTEGYKACMWVWQSGIKAVMALQGNRLSYEQRWVLEKIGAPVHLMLDNNRAGWEGMGNIAKELGKRLTTRIVDYEAEQPDGLTEQAVLACIPQAVDYMKVMLEVS